jgi:ABC-type Mn2+/Zn2+ transport system permease subunit
VHLAFDICQGIGVAAAVGIRPFLPTLAVGALAAGSVETHVKHTHFAFVAGVPFLLGMAVGAIVISLAERRLGPDKVGDRRLGLLLAALGAVLGAILFAAMLSRGANPTWPGIIGGVICAAIGAAATQPLLGRVRARLDTEAATALPVIAEGFALALAVLSVLAPPVGPIVVVLLLWMMASGRRREGQKYAGLRILR